MNSSVYLQQEAVVPCPNGSGSYNIGISLSAKEDSMIDPLVIKKWSSTSMENLQA